MAKKKKKTSNTETLSKVEKNFLSKARIYGKNHIDSLLKPSHDVGIEEQLFQTTSFYEEFDIILAKFSDEIVRLYNLTEFSTHNDLKDLINYTQVLIGYSNYIDILTTKLKEDFKSQTEEHFNLELKNILSIIDEEKLTTSRAYELYRVELSKKFTTFVNGLIQNYNKALDDGILDLHIYINFVLEKMYITLDEILEFLNSILSNCGILESLKFVITPNDGVSTINSIAVPTSSFNIRYNTSIKSSPNKLDINEYEKNFLKVFEDSANFISNVKPIDIDYGRQLVLKNGKIAINSSILTDKSYTYKELNNLAINLGYTFDRQTGDHAIYVKDSCLNVVIPQKKLGKGLQLKILKDLNLV